MAGRRSFVTGGTGFIGANLVRRLLADGDEVHLLVREGHVARRIQDILPDLQLHAGSLADTAAVQAAVSAARPDRVFHLAAHGTYSWQQDSSAIIETNLAGTANLVAACRHTGTDCLVNTGSSSEYGLQDHPPAEDTCLVPNSAYAVTKAAATHWCSHQARESGLPMPTVRLYSIYGPWEEPARLWPTLLIHARRGTLPPLANPDIERDFVDVGDTVEALVRVSDKAGDLEDPGAVFNLGSGRATKLYELVSMFRERFHVGATPDWGSMPNRAWDTTTWISNPGRLEAFLGWRPALDNAMGLEAFATWYEDTPCIHKHYEWAILKI